MSRGSSIVEAPSLGHMAEHSETPQFFVPAATSPEQAEEVRQAVIDFLQLQGYQVAADDRIYSLRYNLRGEEKVSTVGEQDPRVGQVVIGIYRCSDRDGLYFVTTPDRGVARGEPILIGDGMNPRPRHFGS